MLTPASRQMSTRRVASGTPEFPQARKNSFEPPKVPVPRLRTGTFRPERPRIRNSIFGGSLGLVRWRGWGKSFGEIFGGGVAGGRLFLVWRKATAAALLIRAVEQGLRRKILHRGDGGKAEENLRKIEALTAEMQRAQRRAMRVGDAVEVVASWGAASSAPTAYFWNRESRGEGGSETRPYLGRMTMLRRLQGRAAEARPSGPWPVSILPETSSVRRSMTATALSPARAT